jgi:hypothetical protein
MTDRGRRGSAASSTRRTSERDHCGWYHAEYVVRERCDPAEGRLYRRDCAGADARNARRVRDERYEASEQWREDHRRRMGALRGRQATGVIVAHCATCVPDAIVRVTAEALCGRSYYATFLRESARHPSGPAPHVRYGKPSRAAGVWFSRSGHFSVQALRALGKAGKVDKGPPQATLVKTHRAWRAKLP